MLFQTYTLVLLPYYFSWLPLLLVLLASLAALPRQTHSSHPCLHQKLRTLCFVVLQLYRHFGSARNPLCRVAQLSSLVMFHLHVEILYCFLETEHRRRCHCRPPPYSRSVIAFWLSAAAEVPVVQIPSLHPRVWVNFVPVLQVYRLHSGVWVILLKTASRRHSKQKKMQNGQRESWAFYTVSDFEMPRAPITPHAI